MRVNQARVLLIGASGGIGQAMTHQLRAKGAHVVCVGRSWPQGMTKDAIVADITLPSDRARMCELVKEHQINIVVIASGASSFGPFETMTDVDIAQLMQVNVTAPMQLVAALLPELRQRTQAQLILLDLLWVESVYQVFLLMVQARPLCTDWRKAYDES